MAISDKNVLSFTSQDYDTALDEIMSTKRDLMPEYTDDTDTDFGNLILTYCAMLFDILSNKLDYSVNEAIPMLCETMKAMYKHCKWIGYKPRSNQSATTTFEITILNEGEIQYITKGSKVTMESMINNEYVIYEIAENVVCDPPDGLAEGEQYKVTCKGIQGETVTEELGESDGSDDQVFYLNYYPYVEGSLELEAQFSDGRSEYYTVNENNSFVGAGKLDRNIVLEQVDSNTVSVRFGDGINGKVPEDGTTIIAHYRIGGGIIGNRPVGVINTPLFDMPNNFLSIENITEAKGGKDSEDVDDIQDTVSKGRHKIIYSLMRKIDFENFLAKPQRQLYIEKFKVCQDKLLPLLSHRPIAFYLKPWDGYIMDEAYVAKLKEEMEQFRLLDDTYYFYNVEPVYVKVKISIMSDGMTIESQLENSLVYMLRDYIDSLEIGGDDINYKDYVGLYSDDIRNKARSVEGVKRFISMDILDVKYDTDEVGSKEKISENVYDMVLKRGQVFAIENVETDIIVEFV